MIRNGHPGGQAVLDGEEVVAVGPELATTMVLGAGAARRAPATEMAGQVAGDAGKASEMRL